MIITILGHVCIDNNKSENTSYTAAGSPAMFMARVYKHFPQVKTQIIAPYGTDFLPYTNAVSIYPKHPQGDKTLVYENSSQGNLRTQKTRRREYANPIDIDEDLISHIKQSDIIFFAPLTPAYEVQYVKKCFSYAPKTTLKILLPQGYYRDFTEEDEVVQRIFIEADALLPLFDFVIVSEQDHQDMFSIARKWAKVIKVIMTLGSKGALCMSGTQSHMLEVIPVSVNQIVDSVGSGDIFSASFGYRYFLTKDIYTSLEFANDIARQCLFFKPDDLKIVFPR